MRKSLVVLGVLVSLTLIRYGMVHQSKSSDAQKTILNFESFGQGPGNLVLLHGLMASLHYWDGLIPELSKENRVIAPDLFGFGDSPKPAASYSVAEHLGFIERTIDQAIGGTQKFFLIGHSMGTFLALDYAALFPERIKGIILIDPPVATAENSLEDDLRASTSAIMLTMTFSKFWGKAACRLHELFPLLMYPIIRMGDSDLPPRVAKDALKHNWESFSGSLQHVLVEQNFEKLIENVGPLPILILGGVDDAHMKRKRLEKILSSRSNVELKWVKGRHNFLLKHPEDALNAIQPFIRANR